MPDNKDNKTLKQSDDNTDTVAIHDNTCGEIKRSSTNDRAYAELLVKKTDQYTRELQKCISSVIITTDKLLGRSSSSQNRETVFT